MERCSFLFDSFDWQHSKHVQHTHTHTCFLSFSSQSQTNRVAVFVLFVSLGGTQNQTQSCPRRYLQWPKKWSWDTPWEGPKPLTNLKKSRFLGSLPKCQNRWFFSENKSTKKGSMTTPCPHVMDPSRTFSQKSSHWTLFFPRRFPGVIFEHPKKSSGGLSPRRELDFHCSTRSNKYVEKPSFWGHFSPQKQPMDQQGNYWNFRNICKIALTHNFQHKNETSKICVSCR